jgi:hypothetical protein
MKRIDVTGQHPTLTTVCFGRRRPKPGSSGKFKLTFKDYALAALPPPPSSVDYSGGPSALQPNAALLAALHQVLLNDQLGCCTCSGVGHIQDVVTANAGELEAASDADVLKLYEACGGYVPGNPSTDQGCDENTVLDYLCSTGFPDGTKLSAYVALDATNQLEVQQAMALFENLYFGIELPDSYVSPFPSGDGFVWDVGTPDPDNGHCVIGTGFDTTGVHIDSWGMLGAITWPAVAQLCVSSGGGQLFALLTPDIIAKATDKSPLGFDWGSLQTDLQEIGGRGGLAPSPAASTPTPATNP